MADSLNIRSRWLLLAPAVVIGCLLVISGCSTTAPQRGLLGTSQEQDISPDRWSLVQIARDLIGVPYRYGGMDPDAGFDCSGLVYYSYRQQGVWVPRTASQQHQFATPVAASGLRPGDLVFFDTRGKVGHVGIYSGKGRFIHAPSGGGRVREEHLNKPYWRQRWLGGGNLLDG